MKYALIDRERVLFPLPMMCRVLNVSRSGYYKWRIRTPSPQDVRRADARDAVQRIFEASKRTYGSPRIHRELRAGGRRHSRRFVSMLMKQCGLRARAARVRRPAGEPSRVAHVGNTLDRKFDVREIDRVWGADFTFIRTNQGWLYLAVVMDLASRRIVGWSMRTTPDVMLVTRALSMAVEKRAPATGLLHHSDRGAQYCSEPYQNQLERAGMECSLSRIGNCWDNAVVESFFHTLKVERIPRRRAYKSIEEARRDLFEYIEVWYNRKRRHSSLGYISPAEYEARL